MWWFHRITPENNPIYYMLQGSFLFISINLKWFMNIIFVCLISSWTIKILPFKELGAEPALSSHYFGVWTPLNNHQEEKTGWAQITIFSKVWFWALFQILKRKKNVEKYDFIKISPWESFGKWRGEITPPIHQIQSWIF